MDEEKKKEAYQTGTLVLVILVVLTIGEFLFAFIAKSWWQPLILISILKAFYVVRDYMHVSRLFSPVEEGH
jgi:Prokaryotic Cytochrome C oxidase subunit IV